MSTASARVAVRRPQDVPEGTPRTRRRAALALLVSAQFVVMLDTSVVNVALPSVQRDLGLGPAGLAWVVNAYVLAFGGLLLLAGRAADVLGRRRMFVVGSAVFTVGSLLAGSSATEVGLVAGRIVQGVGAASLSTAAMSLLLVMFPGPARAGAMSAWGAASTLGGASGVVVGGVLTGTHGWPWAFFVTVPVTAFAGLLALRVLDPSPGAGAARRFDGLGAALVTGGVLALSHAALSLPQHGLTSPSVLAGTVLAVVLLVAFALVESIVPDPLVPLSVFRSRALTAGVLTAVLGGAARASTFVLVALYLQQVMHLAPQTAGLAMLPTSVTGFAASLVLLPRVLRALGPERTMTGGLVVLALGHLWLARTPAAALYLLDVLPGLLLVAVGVALSFTPTTMVVAAALPAARAGLTSGLASSSTQVGSCLGLATLTAVAIAAGGAPDPAPSSLTGEGFAAAFRAAAAVALTTGLLACTLPRPRR
ncbi:MFS transporter [Ornithinimicrobium avium]|uniref:MFS transporter n=1 Tax=Ornithinimicrobium avium TaxID=2283195 RepID=A0A345NMC2_9MICO|nr:MFS transporter [Ornithinimicrobium avium]AXH96180.1 MFS transporter [Ornithinimicrobium avium]